MTYQELVKKVQTALVKADASKIEEHIAAQVNVTGEAEGAFYMEIKEGVLYVEPFDYNDRDFLLTGDGADVLDIAQGKTTLEAAIADGKVAHEGDYAKMLALGGIIPAAKKRTPRKPKAETEAAVSAKEEATAEKPKRTRRTTKTAAEETAAEKPKKTRKTTKKTTK